MIAVLTVEPCAIEVECGQCHLLQVVASMRDDFEFHGQGAFAPAQAHSQQDAVFLTDQMTVEPLPKDSLERQVWRSTWQDAGWLQHNPLVSNKHEVSHRDHQRDK